MNNVFITSAEDLITSPEQTRAGFVEAALEKNRKAQPLIDKAKSLKSYASTVKKAKDLLRIKNIRSALLTASGISDKSLKYFSESDKDEAINKMIKEFLEPAGADFVNELVYRYLLIKGDTLGGSMRNYVGNIAKIKLIRQLLAALDFQNIAFQVLYKNDKAHNDWRNISYEEAYTNAEQIKALFWRYFNDRLIFFDTTIPIVRKNVDICLYEGDTSDYDCGNIVFHNEKAIMFGELKGGIDPAGADEHWKTGNSALERIRESFKLKCHPIKTSFIAAAIERSMAEEIWSQFKDGTLSNAANITVSDQLSNYCNWIINL